MVGTTVKLESLGSRVSLGDVVDSVAIKVSDARVSTIANSVNPNNRYLQQILVGRNNLRYDPHLEAWIGRTSSSFVGRDISNINRNRKPTQAAISLANRVVQTARNNAPISFAHQMLGVLLDVRYLDGVPDVIDTLPHPDWVISEHPTIIGLGSVAIGEGSHFDPTSIFGGRYPWHGDSRITSNFTQYVEAATRMNRVEAEEDAIYVGDAHTLLHAGPATLSGPRVLARVFAAPLDPFVPPNCYN